MVAAGYGDGTLRIFDVVKVRHEIRFLDTSRVTLETTAKFGPALSLQIKIKSEKLIDLSARPDA